MARVIGIDFGNWQAFVSCVNGMDEKTRMGGTIEDLLPATYRESADGIPNEFFWSEIERNGKVLSNEMLGFAAAKDTNRPLENHLRLLKKHLGEKVTLYADSDKKRSRTFEYDEIIVKMFEYHIKMANNALRENYGEAGTTNLVSVAFPASYRDPAHLEYYINLAEKADSGVRDKNGNMLKVKVVGTICEPAAAGLDRLCEQRENIKSETVTYGVFDLGGGTFDLSIVALYPNGRKYPSGKTYYYDLVCEGRGLNIAGSDFSNRLEELIISKAVELNGGELSPSQMRVIKRNVERCKKELSEPETKKEDETKKEPETIVVLEIDDEEVEIVTTRAEFEEAISEDVNKIMNFTKSFFEEHNNQLPDEIIMTGGSSYIPYIKQRLEQTMPAYKGKIHRHRPSKAASYGAARFYVDESRETSKDPGPIHKKLEFDLGTIVNRDGKRVMSTLLKAGTEIPCSSGEQRFVVIGSTDNTDYAIYRANKLNPDETKIDTDYKMLIDARLDYGRIVPAATKTTCILSVDLLGVAHLKAWENDNVSIKVEKNFSIDNKADDSKQKV